MFPNGIASGSEQTINAVHEHPHGNAGFHVSAINKTPGTHGFEISQHGVSCPSLIPLRVFDGAVVSAHGKANQSSSFNHDTPCAVPCSIHGVILDKGQIDHLSFIAQSDGLHRIEVFASRLGSKLDSIIELRDAEHNLLAAGDDFEGLDAKIDFSAEAGQRYFVSITDKRGNGGVINSYCLEVTSIQPAITAFLPRRDKRSQAKQIIEVPSGNRVLAYFGIRKEGTHDPVSIGLSNLPSSLKVQSGIEQPDSFVIPVVIESTSHEGEFVSLASVINTQSNEKVDFQQIVDLIHGPADTLFHAATTDRVVVATTIPNPFKVELEPLSVPLASDGTLGLKVRVERSGDFDLPIELRLSYLPEWVEAPIRLSFPQIKRKSSSP